MALLHKYFSSKGIWIQNWNEVAGLETGSTSGVAANLELYCWHQDAADATGNPIRSLIAALASVDSYLAFADKIGNGIVDKCSAEDFHALKLQWAVSGVVDTNLGYAEWNADEVRITISGKSLVNIQNRTAAGDTAVSELTTSIYSNPLIGREYSYKGYGARIRDVGYRTSNESAQFVPDSLVGTVVVDATASFLNDNAKDSLKQPVLPNYFTNCMGSKRIRLEPGSIKQSTCYSTVTKSFNGWIKSVNSFIVGATTISGIGQFKQSGPGVGKIIALEKVADMGADNPISIAGERDAIYKSKCFMKKRKFTVPTNQPLS
ncbi:hypothetical protein [Circoviridae 9 LDMD-2013]|uniref:hypothetical protein n=1 Tax=Circoviridae 9 LDMD-2013 TaxID=1379713 RepID=UPI0003847288|nr:hypothetical protein [Circoviridae 9 LDMD-2013]AGS36205.1 hypothetical protein [Circoviridae 9 LDMD-2013]